TVRRNNRRGHFSAGGGNASVGVHYRIIIGAFRTGYFDPVSGDNLQVVMTNGITAERTVTPSGSEFLRAISICQSAVERDPENLVHLGDLGVALQRAGRYEDALTITDHALDIAPNSAQLKLLKSLILLRWGQYRPGFEMFESRLKTSQLKLLWHFPDERM